MSAVVVREAGAALVLYGVDDEAWIKAASQTPSLKRAVELVNASTYPAWWHMVKKHRPDLVENMRAVLGQDIPITYCRTGCGRPQRAQRWVRQGLCSNCDARDRRGVTVVGPAGDRPIAKGRECQLDGCSRGQYAKGHCNLHYRRRRDWGHPGGLGPMRKNWRLSGFTPKEMRACREFVYGRRSDKPQTDEGIRLRMEYEAIIRKDPCVYCGGPGGEVDHIDPYVRGGSAEWANLASACRSCNASKHATPLLVFLLTTSGGDGHESGKRQSRVRSG